ncbi:diguanylate cyclase [bacterium]|nr:diguanylate cyclase [bacterium]
MGLFDSFKNLKNAIDKVENTIYNGRLSLLEVYELNRKLEAEIAQRTKELDTANTQMLTLQHIWEMMNSSEPLSSVLNAIVNSLQGELGYIDSCILQKDKMEDKAFWDIIATSGSIISEDVRNLYNKEAELRKIKIPDIPELLHAIENNEIFHSNEIETLLIECLPDIFESKHIKIKPKANIKSYILIPLKRGDIHFGSLAVFSSRENVTDKELVFLKLFSKQIELAITITNLFQVVKEQAITDSMTGLYNRRYFEEFIQKESKRADRQNNPFTIIGIDLDHLKNINDTYGHNYGDIAIKAVSEVLKNNCRNIDIAARMGGEEFNVILPGVNVEGGMIFAERIRKNIAELSLEKIGNITASIGVGSYPEHSNNVNDLLELVDNAMYESKRNGRNTVSIAKSINETSWQEVAFNTFVDILAKHRVPLDNKTSSFINKKINDLHPNKDIIYQISDILVSTYNPEHSSGKAKKKVLLATLLAKRFELSKENVDKLKIAMLLYDIGNTLIPKELLNKATPLSDEEVKSIKQHPVIAARDILKPISTITDIIPIIEKHHENWDGSGYPGNLSKEDIPIESQIILIVDSYFALMENRPYRKAVSKRKALNIILNGADNKWSKTLAEEFVFVIKNEDLND